MTEPAGEPKTETITLQNNSSLAVRRQAAGAKVELTISGDFTSPCVLHWGVLRKEQGHWEVPPPEVWPPGSIAFGDKAIQSPFHRHNGRASVTLTLNPKDFPHIEFVLFFPDGRRWDNNHGKNYRIDLVARPAVSSVMGTVAEMEWALGDTLLPPIALTIVEQETGKHSWTLMHRFNLCHDLLDRVAGNADGLALIFTWLRFSAIRQLDWQRNYNTQPRELSHSLDRLTKKLGEQYLRMPQDRPLIRLILTTLGRGGDGQRIRDEILNIMHRHHIKEVSGHFLEEWHQKLHNNTTPDDVVICEAYIAFLKSNGNRDVFYRTLADGGVTRKRLQSYERPIRSDPDFIPHLKDALIPDFEHFLGVLKAVHTATDLGTAIHSARYLFDQELHGLMDFIWHHREDRSDVLDLAGKVTWARTRISGILSGDAARVRDLLLLDISLEDFLRVTVEQTLHSSMEGDLMVDLLASVVNNMVLSGEDGEYLHCSHEWDRLRQAPRFGREWSLHAKAVADRLGRAIGSFIDSCSRLLQPKAELLGKGFGAEEWTISLFTEEVVRGRPAFVLSMLLRNLDPLLRKQANLGDWQVISRATASGRLMKVGSLRDIQGMSFPDGTVVVAGSISGDEEVPPGVSAIITPATTDILAHISVRARNTGILFATCFDEPTLQRLMSLEGKMITAAADDHGNVIFGEGGAEPEAIPRGQPQSRRPFAQPAFRGYALRMEEFAKGLVGGKALNLRRLREHLPQWIGVPDSVSLPFGAFEAALADGANHEAARLYADLAQQLDASADKTPEKLLEEIKKAVGSLRPPDALISSCTAALRASSIPVPDRWAEAWDCITGVWASTWNLRAFLSRRARSIPHHELLMSVLIQPVIDARYSFVIHTVNPINGRRDEIYAEVVNGLGEALVGNYPGKALSFTCHKKTGEVRLMTFPDKAEGLKGSGLIFRSDSSGEDLAGFAGAGLYDSIMLPEPARVNLDYTDDPLVWDAAFQTACMASIGKIGIEAEIALGAPQDIEGAFDGHRYWVVQSRPQVGV